MKLNEKLILGSEVETKDFNRILTEFTRIFETNLILPKKKEVIIDTLIKLLDELRTMEQKYSKYCKLEKETYDLMVGHLNRENAEILKTLPDPNKLLRQEFENFMIRGEFVLRYIRKLCVIFFDNKDLLDGDTRRKFIMSQINIRKSYIGPDKSQFYLSLMKNDVNWITKLSYIRGKIEHIEANTLIITDCRYVIENDRFTFHHQTLMPENVKLNKYMQVLFFDLYTYIEDFVAMLINLTSTSPLIVELETFEIEREAKEWYEVDLGNRRYYASTV